MSTVGNPLSPSESHIYRMRLLGSASLHIYIAIIVPIHVFLAQIFRYPTQEWKPINQVIALIPEASVAPWLREFPYMGKNSSI